MGDARTQRHSAHPGAGRIREKNDIDFFPIARQKTNMDLALRSLFGGCIGSTSALSDDLRWRVVYKRLLEEKTFDDIADELVISQSTAQRIWTQFEATGDIASFQGARASSSALVPESWWPYLRQLLTECNAEDSLGDIAEEFAQETGVTLSLPTLCRTLKKMGITRKVVRSPAPVPATRS